MPYFPSRQSEWVGIPHKLFIPLLLLLPDSSFPKKREKKREKKEKEKKKKTYRISPPQRFLSRFGSSSPIDRHATHGLKSRIRQNKDSSMIRFQIVDLFPKENGPEIFTDEFDGVQGSLRTRFEDTVAVCKKLDFELEKKTRGERERVRERHTPTALQGLVQHDIRDHLNAKRRLRAFRHCPCGMWWYLLRRSL